MQSATGLEMGTIVRAKLGVRFQVQKPPEYGKLTLAGCRKSVFEGFSAQAIGRYCGFYYAMVTE
jgi:hypothetical protein